jgi:hypothetical protein
MTDSFKAQLFDGLTVDVLKMALYTSEATLDASTTVYTTSNEVVAAGYTAGGEVLTGVTVNTSNNITYLSFTNPTWTAALTARGALIYNVTQADAAIAILDFGADKTSTGTFTVQLPVNTATSAVIRIA